MDSHQDQFHKLLKVAHTASNSSYSPYSKLRVGAAVLSNSDEIFLGTNVENVSYGLTICAERAAIFNAVSAGHKELKAIAVFSPDIPDLFPCGACLQVIKEFSNDARLILGSFGPVEDPEDFILKVFSLSEVLRNFFSPKDLNEFQNKLEKSDA